MTISRSTRRLLWASSLPGFGKKKLQGLLADTEFFRVSSSDLLRNFPDLAMQASGKGPEDSSFVRRLEETAASAGDRILCPFDEDYPISLKFSGSPSPILFVKGSVRPLQRPIVTVIGTRHPTPAGQSICRSLTTRLSDLGFVIASGLALGLDAVAHETCLAMDGMTVAVLPNGLDEIYPKTNTRIAQRIVAEGGCLVSEYAYGTPAFKGHFIERDAVQARIALGVVLCQTGVVGGSIHASREAVAIGRYLLVAQQSRHDYAERSHNALGNIALLRGEDSLTAEVLRLPLQDFSRIIRVTSRADVDHAAKDLMASFEALKNKSADPLAWSRQLSR